MKKTLAILMSMLMVLSLVSLGSVGVAAETTTLIESGADWEYFAVFGEDTLPDDWYTVGYDTSDWEIGATPVCGIAYANPDAQTQIDAGGEKLTCGFVTTFNVENVADIQVVTMGLFYDENPVVYINGEEVFTASNWNNNLTTFDLSDKKDVLVEGENTIAVYMENAANGGGFNFDLTLEAGVPEIVDANGYVTILTASKTGFANFGAINAETNLLDGNVNSCSGSARNQDVEQSWTLNFLADVNVSEIYLQCKGTEDNVTTSHEDGVTFGYYNVYVGEELVAESVPAVSESDGGYTITLDTAVKGASVKIELTGEWYATNWANLADVTVKGAVAEEAPQGPATITLTPKFGAWENWKNSPNKGDAEAVTQLLVGIQENGATVDIDAALTWKLNIKGGDQDKTITLSPATKALAYDLYRFEVCLAEGDNQFVPVNGVEYTVTIEVYEGETLKYKSEPTAGFTCPMDPIVPAVDEPIDPPADDDGADQAGDAAVYATILVAVAAVALVVISKKRTNI